MKRTLSGLAAATVILGTAIPVTFAASTSSQWFTMSIDINGSTLSTPYGIAESDGSTTTTYIPLYYVNQALSKIGYQSSWDGTAHTWSLTTSQKGLDFSSMVVGNGNTSIMVNGTLVKQINSIVNLDPNGGTSTTYVPIYYVSPIIQALGISAVWNGSNHTWAIGNNNRTTGNGTTGNTSTSGSTTSPGSNTTGTSSSSGTTLSSPSLQVATQNGTTDVDVTNAKTGATITLYDSNGNAVVTTTTMPDGTATFYNVQPGNYYAVETLSGQQSGQSNTVRITKPSSASSPTIESNHSNGVWYISVNNAVANATVTLYSTNGSNMASTNANQYGYATFNNVPSGSYYVIEQTNGQNVQSNAISVNTSSNASTGTSGNLSTPSIVTNSTSDNLTVNSVQSGANVTLYQSSGSVYETATANSAGYVTFSNVHNGTYYAVQSLNGQQSPASNYVTVSTSNSNLNAPNISVSQGNGTASLYISNLLSGATVSLYNSNGSLYGTVTASNSGSATFNNVGNATYYAVQTWNNQQSPRSSDVSVSASNLNTPTVSLHQNNGVGTIYVSNVSNSATVTLYESNGASYAQVTANSSGNATFTNVPSGSYYAVQSLNGSQSSQSSQVTVSSNGNTPSTPNAYVSQNNGNNTYTITVDGATSGATVTLYTSSGSVYSTGTANSSGYATFGNIPSGDYYAVQTWNGYQSARSNVMNLGSSSSSSSTNLATPSVNVSTSNGTGTIVIGNLTSGASVYVYRNNGTVYTSATASSSGYVTFTNVPSGTYYVVQELNGNQSSHSNTISI